MKKPKIIILDIETMPNLDEIAAIIPSIGNWPGRTMKAELGSIICFGYKELGAKQTHCLNAWDYKSTWRKSKNNDKPLLRAISEILNDTDMIITHNGKRFDWKYIQTRLKLNKMPALPKIQHVDTCQLLKSNLSLYSNSLKSAAKALGIEQQKEESGGWELWTKFLRNQETKKDLNWMAKYCKQDVRTTEALYNNLQDLLGNKGINFRLFDDGDRTCGVCGTKGALTIHGRRVSRSGILTRYRCKECGSISQKIGKKKPKITAY